MSDFAGTSELARILGATPQAVAKAASSGRLTVAEIGPKGRLFDVDIAVAEWEATKDAAALQNRASHLPPGMRGGRPRGQAAPPPVEGHEGLTDSEKYLRARAANEALKAKERDLTIKVRTGELLEKAQARKDGEALGAMILGALQAWPSRLAPELASMKDSDEHAFHVMLTREVNELIVAIRAQLKLE